MDENKGDIKNFEIYKNISYEFEKFAFDMAKKYSIYIIGFSQEYGMEKFHMEITMR